MTTENSVLSFHDWKQQRIEKDGGIKHRRDWYQAAYGRYVYEQNSVRVPQQGAGLDTFADELAQEIRRVDGNHTLGAGALADALTPFILARQQSRVVDREMSGRLGDHLREKHGVMLSTKSLQAALRAAIEGASDGR